MQKSDSELQTNEGLKACEVETKQFEAQTNGELVSNESVTANLQEEPAQESTSARGKRRAHTMACNAARNSGFFPCSRK